jgi:hypothetical protein
MKLELLTNATVLDDAIRFVSEAEQRPAKLKYNNIIDTLDCNRISNNVFD